MYTMIPSDIGGGVVRRRFRSGSMVRLANDKLTADEINSIPITNRRALIENGFLVVYPKGPDGEKVGFEKHVVHRGSGRYDVIEGVRLNAEPLTKEAADELAGILPSDAANGAAPPQNGLQE